MVDSTDDSNSKRAANDSNSGIKSSGELKSDSSIPQAQVLGDASPSSTAIASEAEKVTKKPLSIAEQMNERRLKNEKDSFNVSVKKSPWFVYSMLQIPLVVFMVLLLYFLYQSRSTP